NGVFSVGLPRAASSELVLVMAGAMSLIADMLVRVAPKSGIYQGVFYRLPLLPASSGLQEAIMLRALRLNALTDAYADLWADCFDPAFASDKWTCLPERSG